MQTCHEILGHCNYEDALKLQGVVRVQKERLNETRNRESDSRAKKPLELVHSDLAGPMKTPSIDGHKYACVLQTTTQVPCWSIF